VYRPGRHLTPARSRTVRSMLTWFCAGSCSAARLRAAGPSLVRHLPRALGPPGREVPAHERAVQAAAQQLPGAVQPERDRGTDVGVRPAQRLVRLVRAQVQHLHAVPESGHPAIVLIQKRLQGVCGHARCAAPCTRTGRLSARRSGCLVSNHFSILNFTFFLLKAQTALLIKRFCGVFMTSCNSPRLERVCILQSRATLV